MEKKITLSKILAIIGTVLVWFTFVSPLLFGLVSLIAMGRFHFDYFMPAEFFLFALLGAGLLLLAALLTHVNFKRIAWGTGLAILFLLGVLLIASVTGLASGEVQEGGWQSALVLVFLALYWLCLGIVGIGGIRLIRSLTRPRK